MSDNVNKNRVTIQAAALQLFKEHGIQNVSITQICKAAHCSPSTFYYQFGNKNNLLFSLISFDRIFNQETLSDTLTMSSPWEKLWRIHESYATVALELGPEVYGGIFHSNLAELIPEFFSHEDKINNLITPLIIQGQAYGEIRNQSPAASLADTVSKMLSGTNYSWCCSKGSFDLKATVKRNLENVYDIRMDLRAKNE